MMLLFMKISLRKFVETINFSFERGTVYKKFGFILIVIRTNNNSQHPVSVRSVALFENFSEGELIFP